MRMRASVSAALAGLLALCAVAQDAQAQALKLVTGNDYQPYSDQDLPYGGLGTMIVKAVFENMQQPAEIIFDDWEKGYKGVLDGTYTATFPYIQTAEREKEMLYSLPLFVVRPTVFSRADSLNVYGKVGDLEGLTMCRPANWAIDKYLADWVEAGKIRIADAVSVPDCFKMLSAGQVDFVSVDRLLGAITAKVINPTPGWIRQGQLVKLGNPNYLIVAKSNKNGPALIEAFNRSMGQLTERGVIGELVKRFFALSNR